MMGLADGFAGRRTNRSDPEREDEAMLWAGPDRDNPGGAAHAGGSATGAGSSTANEAAAKRTLNSST